jgi:branched-subunit amino acid transport protein
MSVWGLILALTVITLVMRIIGISGGSLLRSARLVALLPYLAPAVIAGLVVSSTISSPDGLVLDARAAGVAAAIIALLLRAPVLLTILIAMSVTGVVRLIL